MKIKKSQKFKNKKSIYEIFECVKSFPIIATIEKVNTYKWVYGGTNGK